MPRFAIFLSAFVVACAPAAEPPVAQSAAPAAVAPAAAPAAAAAVAPASGAATAPAEGALTVRIHGGADVLTVSPASDGSIAVNFTVDGQKTSLVGRQSDASKRKYRAGDAILFETKWDDDGFKLRAPDGKLLYKVKFKDDKVKVSDNEESANPFELKTREGDRVKVVAPGDKEIGNVRATVVEDAAGKKLFDVSGRAGMSAYGVLLLDQIPPAQRYVILAELFSRGK